MEKVNAYEDRTIILLRNKVRQEMLKEKENNGSLVMGGKAYPLRSIKMEDRFSIMLPEFMQDMDKKHARIRYPGIDRPDIIKTDNHHAVLTFNFLTEDSTGQEIYKSILNIIRKRYRQNVFYDNGDTECSNGRLYWSDYKGFNLKGSYYGLVFLADAGGRSKIWGNFHCVFKEYDIWKPAVIKLLKTIHFDEI